MSQGGHCPLDFISCDLVHPNLEKLGHSEVKARHPEPLLGVSWACWVVYHVCFLKGSVKPILRGGVSPILSQEFQGQFKPKTIAVSQAWSCRKDLKYMQKILNTFI